MLNKTEIKYKQNRSDEIKVKCECCNVDFFKLFSQVKSTNSNFCSTKCAAIINNKRRKENGFTNSGKTKEIICKQCNKFDIVAKNAILICKECSLLNNNKRLKKLKIQKNTECIVCGKIFLAINARYCYQCCRIKAGLASVRVQKETRRSKNEMYFAELCKHHFKTVLENANIFDGWDADVVIEDIKVAVLWNGNWHHKKITKKHSVLQVQTRDKIKQQKIIQHGYKPFIINDYGRYNTEFVKKQFEIFLSSTSSK